MWLPSLNLFDKSWLGNGDNMISRDLGQYNHQKYMPVAKHQNFDKVTMGILQWLCENWS